MARRRRVAEDEAPVMPERLRRFVPIEWDPTLVDPGEHRRIGNQSPTLVHYPAGVAERPALTPGPPDPYAVCSGVGSWVDAEGRWWLDVRVHDAQRQWLDARRAWYNETGTSLLDELRASRAARRAGLPDGGPPARRGATRDEWPPPGGRP